MSQHGREQSAPCSSFWNNEPSRVFVARAGRHELAPVILNAEKVRELVERILSSSGRRQAISQPFADAMLSGGHRLHVVLEGTSGGLVRRPPAALGRHTQHNPGGKRSPPKAGTRAHSMTSPTARDSRITAETSPDKDQF